MKSKDLTKLQKIDVLAFSMLQIELLETIFKQTDLHEYLDDFYSLKNKMDKHRDILIDEVRPLVEDEDDN